MAKLFDLGQVTELYAIQNARLRRGGEPIGDVIAEVIKNLTKGGVAGRYDDIRMDQAHKHWECGLWNIPTRTDFRTFRNYLESIPEIDAELLKDDPEFPLIVLVEPRLGLKLLCDIARPGLSGIAFDGDDMTFDAYDKRHAEFTKPTWIRVQDGRKNHNRSDRDCRASFGKNELGLTALQGVCTYIQYPQVVGKAGKDDTHVMRLPGSDHSVYHGNAPHLFVSDGRPKLSWNQNDDHDPVCGSASRRAS